MHHPRGTTSTPRRLLAAATWLLLLGGLFAMHGLGTHGTHGAEHRDTLTAGETTSETAATSNRVAMSHLGHDASQSMPGPQAQTPGPEAAAGTPSLPGPGMSTLGLCLAIIGGLILGVTAWILAQRSRHLFAAAAPRAPRVLVLAGRDRDPPCRVRLSVMRC